MKTYIKAPKASSTYALLMRSEQEDRSFPETFVYALLIGSAALAIWYAALQPFRVPVGVIPPALTIAQAAPVAQPEQV
jgi:hypothetical protein